MIKKIITSDKEIVVSSVSVEEKQSQQKTLKKYIIINNSYIVKKYDKIMFVCDSCNIECVQNYGYNKKFLDSKILCQKCETKKKWLTKYGVENAFQSPQTKKTLKEKYNVDNVMKISEVKEKQKKATFDHYGFDHNFKVPQIIETIKKTNIEKYGTEFPMQSDSIKEKSKNRMIQHYGVPFNFCRKEIQEKSKSTIKSENIKKFFYSDRLKNLVEPMFLESEYINSVTEYKWKCNKCQTIFLDNLAMGKIPRCPVCFPLDLISSRNEKEIVDWLKSLNLDISENNREIINPLELDIYIPSKNLAIEFDGLYWHSELQGKDSKYHLNKTTKCKKLEIQLLHVWENEWIEKQNIVKSIIKSKLGLYDRVIGARKCIVKEIFNKQASDFYDQNHIQGRINSKVNIGLFFNDELVSCLSFSKPRYNKAYEWEITRFANLLNTTVHGSFGKLWDYFQKSYNPKSLITYSDKRYFDGSIYKKYFTELQDSKPSYWYIKNGQVCNRMEFQKHKLSKLEQFDPELTEWENMQLNGWDRIWDCGNKIFVKMKSD